MAYVHFTDDQKQRANSVDLVDFLQRQGEQLVRSGREWRWKRYDSVTVRGNEWFRHSRKEGGHAIDFVQQFYDLSFPDAVILLLGGESGVEWNQTAKSAPPPKKEFKLPESNPDMRRVFAYLIKQRFISHEVLSKFAHEKMIYEDKDYHNAVFVGRDENGIIKHAHKRGTYTKGEPFKGNVEGSDPQYSFHWIGKSDSLYVFEAPVDMLSYITLHQKNWRQHSYVTLDGVSEHAMIKQLQLNPHLKRIVLCLDHDEAGIEAVGRLSDILIEKGYTNISTLQPTYKDWNEDLKERHAITPIQAKEHPKLELLPYICDELSVLCDSLSIQKDMSSFILDCQKTLKPLLASGKVVGDNKETIKECLQSMAAGSLLLLEEQCKQMERPITREQLIRRLQASYRPHEDRGWLRTKIADIQKHLSEIQGIRTMPGIRSLEDQNQLSTCYLRFALGCVKAWMFVELEMSEILPNQEQNAKLIMSV